MIKFFRNLPRRQAGIRQNMLTDLPNGKAGNKPASPSGRFSKYLAYALGEIILVVIGILIALQINNLNEVNKTRAKEITYLKNVKNDLELTNLEIDQFIITRTESAIAASNIVEHYNGKAVTDWNEFNKNTVDVYTWQKFYQTDNTFQELMNSGNFTIISNDSIKNEILTVDKLYKKLAYTEDHFRFDAEITLYDPSYGMVDIHSLSNNYIYQKSAGNEGALGNVNENDFREMLKDQRQKNGFAFAAMYFNEMNITLAMIKEKNENIISLIDREIENED